MTANKILYELSVLFEITSPKHTWLSKLALMKFTIFPALHVGQKVVKMGQNKFVGLMASIVTEQSSINKCNFFFTKNRVYYKVKINLYSLLMSFRNFTSSASSFWDLSTCSTIVTGCSVHLSRCFGLLALLIYLSQSEERLN